MAQAAFIVAAWAQIMQPAALAPSTKWLLNPVDRVCELTLSFGDVSAPTILLIRRQPLQTRNEVRLFLPVLAGSGATRSAAAIRNNASGEKVDGSAILDRHDQGGWFSLTVDDSFLERVAPGETLTIEAAGKALVTIDPARLGIALKARSDCDTVLLERWGIDPDAVRGLQKLPVPTTDPIRWLTPDDYPLGAIIGRKEGDSLVRYRVKVDGSIDDCAVAVSSGSPELDQQACAVLKRRARYRPAIGANGKPIDATIIMNFAWRAPAN